MKIKCVICDCEYHKNYFASHLIKIHKINLREYYDKFLIKDGEGVCLICKKQTTFSGMSYKKTCSKKCASDYRNNLLFEKHGVKNLFQIKDIQDKSRKTMLEKYGVENVSKLDFIKEKKEKTCLKNFGVKNPSYSAEIREKANNTNLLKFGVKHVMHNKDILEKCLKNGAGKCRRINYKTKFGNNIIIQGSYEYHFVKHCEDNNFYIENGPCIDYIFNGKKRKYFIDFKVCVNEQIKLVEIKSTYYFIKYRQEIEAKKQSAEIFAKNNNMIYELQVILNSREQRKGLKLDYDQVH